MFRMFAFAGALSFGWIAFGEEKTASSEEIRIDCPVNSEGSAEENGKNCENCNTPEVQQLEGKTAEGK